MWEASITIITSVHMMDIKVYADVTSRLHDLFMVATEKSTATDDASDELFPGGPLMLVGVRTDLILF